MTLKVGRRQIHLPFLPAVAGTWDGVVARAAPTHLSPALQRPASPYISFVLIGLIDMIDPGRQAY